jgi:hypothetical protein
VYDKSTGSQRPIRNHALNIGQDISKYHIPDSCPGPCCVFDPKALMAGD